VSASSGRSLNSRTFVSRESRSCDPAVATKTSPRTALQTHLVSVARRPEVSNSAACEWRWSRTWLHKTHWNVSAPILVDIRSESAYTRPCVSRVGATTSPVDALPHGKSHSAVVAWGNHTANYRAARRGKKRRRPLQTSALKSAATGHPAAPKTQRSRFCHVDGPGRRVESHSPRGPIKATTTPPRNPNSSPQPARKAPKQPNVTIARKAARPKKPEPNLQQPLSRLLGSPRRRQPPTTTNLLVPTQISTSPFEHICDILDRLILQAYVEVTRRVFKSISSLRTGAPRPRAVLKPRPASRRCSSATWSHVSTTFNGG
jgi:hypothetical protein